MKQKPQESIEISQILYRFVRNLKDCIGSIIGDSLFIVTDSTEKVVDRHRLTTSLKLNKYHMNFIPVISLPISAAKVRQINKVRNT